MSLMADAKEGDAFAQALVERGAIEYGNRDRAQDRRNDPADDQDYQRPEQVTERTTKNLTKVVN